MNQYETGMLVKSKSGHDRGRTYVIMDMQGEYLFLVDGVIRKLDTPKKKKKKHVQRINIVLNEIVDKIKTNSLTDEDVKREIKRYRTENELF